MDKQRKAGDDKDAILIEVPIYFITHDESKADVLEVSFLKVSPIIKFLVYFLSSQVQKYFVGFLNNF